MLSGFFAIKLVSSTVAIADTETLYMRHIFPEAFSVGKHELSWCRNMLWIA